MKNDAKHDAKATQNSDERRKLKIKTSTQLDNPEPLPCALAFW